MSRPRLGPLAVMLWCVMACAAFGPAVASAQTGGIAEARERAGRGEALYDRGDYDAAIAEFQAAYEAAGEHPDRFRVLYNVAQCHERLFSYDEAMSTYRRYLEEGADRVEDRAAVEATIRTLENLLGTLRVTSNVRGAAVWIGERHVGDTPAELLVPSGRHVIEVRAPGHEPARRDVEVVARAEREVAIPLTRLAEAYRGISPTYFWLTASAAGVAVVIGGVVGALALTTRGDIDARLEDPARRFGVSEADREDVQRLALLADVAFATGAVLAIGATVLAFITDFGGEEEREAPPRPAARVRPLFAPGFAGLGAEGQF